MDTKIKKNAVGEKELGNVFGGSARPSSLPRCIYCGRAVFDIKYRATIGEYVCNSCWEDRNPGDDD